MALTIPKDFQELEKGEIISPDCLFCPKGENKFKKFKKQSKAIGGAYKHVATPLYQETVVIKPVPKAKLFSCFANIRATDMSTITNIVAKDERFRYFQKNFQIEDGIKVLGMYIVLDYADRKWVGFCDIGEPHNLSWYASQGAKQISRLDMMNLLTPKSITDPEFQKTVAFSLDIQIKLGK